MIFSFLKNFKTAYRRLRELKSLQEYRDPEEPVSYTHLTKGTHDYLEVLEKLGRPSPPIDERLEHILITGMFNTFFELIIHEMPLEDAKHYLEEMRAFYTAGWMKIMGQ